MRECTCAASEFASHSEGNHTSESCSASLYGGSPGDHCGGCYQCLCMQHHYYEKLGQDTKASDAQMIDESCGNDLGAAQVNP